MLHSIFFSYRMDGSQCIWVYACARQSVRFENRREKAMQIATENSEKEKSRFVNTHRVRWRWPIYTDPAHTERTLEPNNNTKQKKKNTKYSVWGSIRTHFPPPISGRLRSLHIFAVVTVVAHVFCVVCAQLSCGWPSIRSCYQSFSLIIHYSYIITVLVVG